MLDLASLAAYEDRPRSPAVARTRQLRHATLGHEQVSDDRTLLALRVNGLTLSLDHGYPARMISPAIPGVHCTKWVSDA